MARKTIPTTITTMPATNELEERRKLISTKLQALQLSIARHWRQETLVKLLRADKRKLEEELAELGGSL